MERCEFLTKLDLTINFVDVDDLQESVDNLVDRDHLRDLFMMGNPCEQEWKGFKNYIIARLPQISQLDGTEITRSMRITAVQQLPALVHELRGLAEARRERRRWEEREMEEERRGKEEKRRRKEERREAIEGGRVVVEDVGESSEEEEEEMTGHTPEVRNEIYKEMAEQKAEKEAREKENQPQHRGEKVRGSVERSDELTATMLATRSAQARTSVQDAPTQYTLRQISPLIPTLQSFSPSYRFAHRRNSRPSRRRA